MNPVPLLVLEGVAAGYGSRPVLRDIHLSLEQAGFTAVLGANGSGKTTLLKTLAGLLPPIAGNVRTGAPGAPRPRLGYVPQREGLDPTFPLSAFEVALMGAYGRLRPVSLLPEAEAGFTRHCLGLAGAAEIASHPFARLSGGQKQRVLIARALVTRPDLLLLDEPTAGIDTATARGILSVLRDINRDQHTTILLVSHDLALVREFVKDVIVVRQGTAVRGSVGDLMTPAQIARLLEISLG